MVALTLAGARRGRACAATASGVGDGSLYRALLAALERARGRARCRCSSALSRRDLVGLERARRARSGWAAPSASCSCACPSCAAGPRCSTARDGPGRRGRRGACARLHELLAERGVADRVIFDLGLVRELGYYTGAVFEVYDPAVGFALGGGGRYDDLLGRFGRAAARRAASALDVQRVHVAQAAEEALAMSDRLTIAVPRGALFDEHARPARRGSASTPPRCARTTASCSSPTPAS